MENLRPPNILASLMDEGCCGIVKLPCRLDAGLISAREE